MYNEVELSGQGLGDQLVFSSRVKAISYTLGTFYVAASMCDILQGMERHDRRTAGSGACAAMNRNEMQVP